MKEPIVDCRGVFHIYKTRNVEVVALQGLDLRMDEGEMIAVVGRSGSGKTTLLNVLAGMQVPSAGTARVAGFDLTTLTTRQRDHYRREAVGYLWQNIQLNLTPELSAAANVELPMLGTGVSPSKRHERSAQLLEALGILHRANHIPSHLSSGEKQRLGLAMALANGPRLLLADEPTGQLDRNTARVVLDDLRTLQRELGTSVLLVTHDHQVERQVDRVIAIRDGRTSTETRWRTEEASDELVIMDRAGRIQIPRAYVDKLGLKDRVRVRLEDDDVIVSRDDKTPTE
jgi:putative ABC transport system ATP-binding protein